MTGLNITEVRAVYRLVYIPEESVSSMVVRSGDGK